MKIKGLQKTTLIDYPGEVACTIFIWGCNFRCGFCHNPELVINDEGINITEKEIIDFLDKRKDYLDAICITGGEPLLNLEKSFLKEIKSLGYKIKIDTNGSFPEKLKEFIDENLVDFIAMDIKSNKENYQKITNSNIDINKIEESIKLVSLFKNYEFRITIMEDIHTKEEIKEIGEWLNNLIQKKALRFVLQGFKNYGKFVDNFFKTKDNTTERYLNELKIIAEDYFEEVEVRK